MGEHYPQRPVRVVVVDDEEIQRLGTVAALTTNQAKVSAESDTDDSQITLIVAVDVDTALTYDWATAAPDVVLLDAWTPAPIADNEHYFGVQVAESIHRSRADRTTVIVLTNHGANPALGWRLREAGVTAMVPRARVTTRDRLRALVLAPDHADILIRDTDTDTEPDLGLGHGLHLNALLQSIRADPKREWIYTSTERPTSTGDPTRYRQARTEGAPRPRRRCDTSALAPRRPASDAQREPDRPTRPTQALRLVDRLRSRLSAPRPRPATLTHSAQRLATVERRRAHRYRPSTRTISSRAALHLGRGREVRRPPQAFVRSVLHGAPDDLRGGIGTSPLRGWLTYAVPAFKHPCGQAARRVR